MPSAKELLPGGEFRQRAHSCTLAGALERNRPGVLVHDFPDNDLHGWLHNSKLMKLPASETFHNAKPSRHRRFLDRTSPP